MAITYRIEEKVGIGTILLTLDDNLADRSGWTVHGTGLSNGHACTKIQTLLDAGSDPKDIRIMRDDGGVPLYSPLAEDERPHLETST